MLKDKNPQYVYRSATFHKKIKCVYYNAQILKHFNTLLKGIIFGLSNENQESWKLQQLCYTAVLLHITM